MVRPDARRPFFVVASTGDSDLLHFVGSQVVQHEKHAVLEQFLGLGRVSSHLHYGGRLLLQRMGLRYSLTVTFLMVYTTTLIRFLIRFLLQQQRLWLLLQR